MPPYLAGREKEEREFRRLLEQDRILKNLVLTGLRGVGKTVLLERLKPIAVQAGWLWVGTDLSESTSVTEDNLATRVMTDLAVVTGGMVAAVETKPRAGFAQSPVLVTHRLGYQNLRNVYEGTAGLTSDKLKQVLELVAEHIQHHGKRGLIFAYDEAQNLADHAEKDQYPLSLMLDVFQSIQRKGIPFLLVLTGLPTLFPKLVEARTFSERMFQVLVLNRLNDSDSRDAILKPTNAPGCKVSFDETSVVRIVQMSGGYPYFIQFICRETFDVFIQRLEAGDERPAVPADEILRKLDSDFFAGRWARATDRQRALLGVVASLSNCEDEFTVQEVVEASKQHLTKPFSSSHVNQMLATLAENGLVYKNRHGRYSFAVPLLNKFIRRQSAESA